MNFIVGLALFPFDIMFSFGETDDRLAYELKKYGLKYDSIMDMPKTNRGKCVFDDEAHTTLIRMSNKLIDASDYGTLSHEIYHAVCFILRTTGIELCDETEEVFAYCIGDITQKCIAKIEKLNLKFELAQKNTKKE